MSGTMAKKANSKQLFILLAVIEVVFITLFGFFVRYDEQWSDEETTRYRFIDQGTDNTASKCELWILNR